MQVEEIHAVAAARLAAAGLRYTRSRRRIVEVLARATSPMQLPAIVAADPGLAVSSTYRNVAELVAAGVAHRIVTSDEHAHVELSEDLLGHHHHLVCRVCGGVSDFHLPEELEARLDEALGRLADATGFAVEHHRLDALGRCRRCTAD